MTKLDIHIEFAKRQFDWLRVMADINTKEGRVDVAKRFANMMQECNNEIDNLYNRKLKE